MNAFMNRWFSLRRLLCLTAIAACTLSSTGSAAPPVLVSATASCGGSEVVATFDQPVEPTLGLDQFNYVVIDGAGNPNTVIATAISADFQTVTLNVEIPLGANLPHTLMVIFMCSPEFECSQQVDTIPILLADTPILCNVALDTLLPTNSQMIDVGLLISSAGGSSPQVRVFSDEPQDPSAIDGSYENGILQLRSKRAPQGNGRVYLIIVTSADACGQAAVCCATVVVPRNSSQGALDSVNAQALAAKAECSPAGSSFTPHEITLVH